MSDHPPAISRAQLEAMGKNELIELLLMALEAQEMTTRNMKTMNEMLSMADVRIKDLDSKNKSQEAELIMLRAK